MQVDRLLVLTGLLDPPAIPPHPVCPYPNRTFATIKRARAATAIPTPEVTATASAVPVLPPACTPENTSEPNNAVSEPTLVPAEPPAPASAPPPPPPPPPPAIALPSDSAQHELTQPPQDLEGGDAW